MKLKDYENAEKVYLEIKDIRPNMVSAKNNLEKIYIYTGKFIIKIST